MRKLILTAIAAAAMAFAAVPALADEVVRVDSDDVPLLTTFDGTYDTGQPDDPDTAEDESTGTQQGYLAVYDDPANDGPEVQACNGNEDHSASAGRDLTGYIYISPSGSGEPNGEIPGSNEFIGATDGQQVQSDGSETGDPCPN